MRFDASHMAVFVCATGWRDQLGRWVGDGKAQSLIRILDSCVSFMLNKYVGIIYFGVFIGMEDYSKMTRLWVDHAIYDTPVLDDGFTNCG
jgi:hypothetical protein